MRIRGGRHQKMQTKEKKMLSEISDIFEGRCKLYSAIKE